MRRIADLSGLPVVVSIHCGCTAVKTVPADWLLKRLGPEATIEDAERQLPCTTCGQPVRLFPELTWGAELAAKRGILPEGLPDWVKR